MYFIINAYFYFRNICTCFEVNPKCLAPFTIFLRIKIHATYSSFLFNLIIILQNFILD